MRNWDDEHALEWRRSFGPPARPTQKECMLYRRELTRLGRESKVLLLGSTPEIRDQVAELGLQLTVVDFNEKNYRELQALMNADPKSEGYVKQDWADMEFDSEFDFVVGDNVLSVLDLQKAKRIVANVHRALKPKARWVTRVMLYNEGEDFISPDTLNGRIRNCGTKREIYERLYVPFLAYYKNEVGAMVGRRVYEKMLRDVDKGLFPAFCKEVFLALSYYEDENYLVKREEFEKDIGGQFKIVRSYDRTEPFSKNWVIYVLAKN
jgi:hypothetical protein